MIVTLDLDKWAKGVGPGGKGRVVLWYFHIYKPFWGFKILNFNNLVCVFFRKMNIFRGMVIS